MASDSVDVDTAPHPAPSGADGGWVLADRYRITSRLGQGGVAEVFRARDEHIGRDVAVKVFRTAPDGVGDAERRDVELHALARLSHPNLVTLFDASVGEGNRPEFLVMELVEGATLADALADGPLPLERVRELGVQLTSALAYVHESGVVHRDVKPGNILLCNDGTGSARALLTDFGIARIVGDARLTRAGMTVCTAAYLAPEQVRGAEVGPPADVYALGLVLIEALTGDRCYSGAPTEAAVARLASGPQVPGRLPSPWPELLVAMTSAEPDARPSAAEVARSLGAQEVRWPLETPAAVGVPVPAETRTAELPALEVPVAAAPARRRGRPLLLTAALLILAMAGAAAYLLASSAQPDPGPPAVPGAPSQTSAPASKSHTASRSHQAVAPVVQHSSHPADRSHATRPQRTHSSAAPVRSATSSATTTTPPPTTSATSTPPASPPPTTATTTGGTSGAPPSP